jgi:hypothetical protein
LVKDTISFDLISLHFIEVLAWGAGGRGFKSHWPHVNLVPLFSPTSLDIIKLHRIMSDLISK